MIYYLLRISQSIIGIQIPFIKRNEILNIRIRLFVVCLFNLKFVTTCFSQSPTDSSRYTLQQCIDYAIENQPLHKQSLIDLEINESTNRKALGAWYPQFRTEGNFTHFMLLPVVFFPKTFGDPTSPRVPFRTGLPNVSNVLFQGEQILFSNEVMLAVKASKYTRIEAEKNRERSKIQVITSVSKAFYNVLMSEQQLILINQDIDRKKKLMEDTYNLFQTGVADKLDYKRTGITLNNSLSQKKRIEESIPYMYAALKQLMGYEHDKTLTLAFDNSNIEKEIQLDTLQNADYNNRVEYKSLQARMELQKLNVKLYKTQYIPNFSGFVNYNFVYQNKDFNKLLNQNYPNSSYGVKASLPIFTGMRKKQDVAIARLQVQRLELDMTWFKDQVSTEYALALGTYKANLLEFKIQKENITAAQEVYELVKLQYQQGIKTYLDVITSESDLMTTQFNYQSALFNLLNSKLEVQRVLGSIN